MYIEEVVFILKDNLINRLETSLFHDENQKKRYRCF